jgi:sulfur relay (sulfurtransferase) complex TusBCD TusD component (DsrE family)
VILTRFSESKFSELKTKEVNMANFLFVLSKDENEAATRCFQFAKIAHSKGHKTNLFLIDSGVKWANSERDLNLKTPTGDCPNDYLPYLVEKEVPIGV